jgi:ParB family chromosome partitioning protein
MTETIQDIPVRKIQSDMTFNCRGEFRMIDCTQLARDIKENGLIQPILVRKIDDPKYDYKIVAGHRRHASFLINSAETIPCIVREMTESEAIVANFSENLNRQDLDIVQEAYAIDRLKKAGWDIKLLEKKLKLSRGWFAVREKLVKLPPEIQEEARAGVLNQHHIQKISRLRTKEAQFDAVRKIKELKAKGIKTIQVGPKTKKDPGRPSVRNKTDIQNAIKWWLSFNDEGATTYFLAWVSGTISDLELMIQLKSRDPDFEIPDNYQIPDMDDKLEIRPGEYV